MLEQHHLPQHQSSVDDSTEQFFESAIVPSNLEQVKKQIKEFVDFHLGKNAKIALVSSGGTTVPLERNTVRFLDNFSGGGRGAASTEYFIENGYAVIFLTRRRSLQPYERHVLIHSSNILDYLDITDGSVHVETSHQERLGIALQKYKQASQQNMILKIGFTAVQEYIFLLRAATTEMARFGKNALVYSAAAVSDYYIPFHSMSEHKIQSSQGALVLKFEPVPKMLKPLCTSWAPKAYVATFKLETDVSILDYKATSALKSYGHQVVIGNLLSNHKDRVVFYTQDGSKQVIERSSEEIAKEIDIEKQMVCQLVQLHEAYTAM